MSSFDPTKHPRGNQTTGHAGQFATKQQTGAEIGLDTVTRKPSYESVRNAFATGDYAAGADAITALRATPGDKAVGLLIADALQTHQQGFLANVAQPDGTTYGDRIPVDSGDALEQLGDAFDRGDLQRANELERNLRAREPSVVVDEVLEHAIRRGIGEDTAHESQTR